jgi:hypothetical protein
MTRSVASSSRSDWSLGGHEHYACVAPAPLRAWLSCHLRTVGDVAFSLGATVVTAHAVDVLIAPTTEASTSIHGCGGRAQGRERLHSCVSLG